LRDASVLALGSQGTLSETPARPTPSTLVINPTPLFDISPHLYMQFMEPLRVTDSSGEAAWDRDTDDAPRNPTNLASNCCTFLDLPAT